MNQFRYTGFAEIIHLNTRKEGGEDDKELALDVKFQTRTDSYVCGYFEPTLEYFFFLPETGAVRNKFINPVSFTHELNNYRLKAMNMIFTGVKVKKISLQPADGKKVDITFLASFKPSSTNVAMLAEFLMEAIVIDLGPENNELELEL